MADMTLADPGTAFNPFIGSFDKSSKIIVSQSGGRNTFSPASDSGVLHGVFSQIKKAEPEVLPQIDNKAYRYNE